MRAMLNQIESAMQPGDSVGFIFQGGEPTLAGLDYYRELVETVKQWDPQIRVSYALQTNAIAIDEEWCSFFAENRFLIGVSYDLLPECHDDARPDTAGHGTAERVREAICLLERYAVEYNVLCTLTRQTAAHPGRVWRELRKNGIRYVQFIPCLGELGKPGESNYALTPLGFADFYIPLFSKWKKAFSQGKYISIKLIDDYVNLLGQGAITACGMTGACQPQIVVEADGSVYPCDFYCMDEYCLGNITTEPLETLWRKSFLSSRKQQYDPLVLCSTCPYKNICGGGCKRMRNEVCFGGGDVCGTKKFLDYAINDLINIAAKQ